MPPDAEPPPADPPTVTDEVLHLLHDLLHASRDRWAPGIAATLHQWHDIAAMLAQVPDGARRAGFGRLGHLIDAAGERVATLHTVSRLSFDGSGRYRIEPVLPRRGLVAAPGGDDHLRRRVAVEAFRGRRGCPARRASESVPIFGEEGVAALGGGVGSRRRPFRPTVPPPTAPP